MVTMVGEVVMGVVMMSCSTFTSSTYCLRNADPLHHHGNKDLCDGDDKLQYLTRSNYHWIY